MDFLKIKLKLSRTLVYFEKNNTKKSTTFGANLSLILTPGGLPVRGELRGVFVLFFSAYSFESTRTRRMISLHLHFIIPLFFKATYKWTHAETCVSLQKKET